METDRVFYKNRIFLFLLFVAAVILCLFVPSTVHAGYCRYNRGCGCQSRGLDSRVCTSGYGYECWADENTHAGCNGHSWKRQPNQVAATCTTPTHYKEVCSICGKERWIATGGALGHIPSGWTDVGGYHVIYCTRDANGCGHQWLQTANHRYGGYTIDNANTHHQTCADCGHVLTDAHHFSDWEDAPERPGWQKAVCQQCGYTIWRDVKAPDASITASPVNQWTAGDATVTMKAHDQGSGLQEIRLYRKSTLTGQEACVSTYPFNQETTEQTRTYTEKTEGRFTYRMEVSDQSGNVGKAGPTEEVLIDHSNPKESANIGSQSTKTETRTGTKKVYNPGPKKAETQYKDEEKQPVYDTQTVTIKGEEKVTKYNEVTYNLDGGHHNGMAPYEYINGQEAVVPDPVKDGYSFGGWTVTCNGKSIVSTPTRNITISKDSTGDLAFTAHWGTYYGITFNGNGADGGSMKNVEIGTIGSGESYTLPKNGFTRTGYTFNGWNTKADGSGTAIADGATVKDLTTQTEYSVPLYAQWKVNQYTITRQYRLENADGTWSGYKQIDSKKYNYNTTVPAWNRAADDTYQAATIAAHKVQAKNETLSVDVHRKTSTNNKIQYRLQNADGTYPTTYTNGWSGTLRAGESHSWSRGADGTYNAASGSVSYNQGTVSVNVTRQSRTVTWNGNGGSTPEKTTKLVGNTIGTLPTPTRTGYTFNGWFTAASGGTQISADTQISNVTYYAHWTINQYYLDLNGYINGATFGGLSPAGTADVYINGTKVSSNVADYYQKQNYGTSYEIVPHANAGYTYNGLKSGSAALKGTIPANNIGVVLSYTANSYSVKFNANGGNGSMANEAFTYGQTKALTANAFTRSGYTFSGWATSAGGAKTYNNSQSVSNLTTTANGVVNLYAVWAKDTYTISYNLNGGSNPGNPGTYQVDSSFTLKNPSRTGYTFTGWTGSNGTTAQTTVTIPAGSTGNKSYTANWKINNYTASFNGNGGSNGTSITKAYGSQLGTLPGSSRTGYTFAGWWTAASGGTQVSTTTTMPASNVTYYAHWNVNQYTITRRYRLQNADGSWGGYTQIDSKKYNYGSTVAAWSRAQDSDYNAASIAAHTVAAKDETLSVDVSRRTYTISYNLNGGSISGQPTSYRAGQSVSIPQPTRSGYTFAGWTGTGLSERTLSVTVASSSRTNISLSAEWKASLNVEERIARNSASGSYMTLDAITDQNGYSYNPDTNTGDYKHWTSPIRSYVLYYQGPSQYNNSNYHLTIPTYSGNWSNIQSRTGKTDIKWYGSDTNLYDSTTLGNGFTISENPNKGGGNYGHHATPGYVWKEYGLNFSWAMYAYGFTDGATSWDEFYPVGKDYVKDQDYPNGRPLVSCAYLYKNGTSAAQAVDALQFFYQLLGYVNYDSNGGNGGTHRIQHRFGTNIVIPICNDLSAVNQNDYAGTRNGYTFLGWSGSKNGDLYHSFYWNPWYHSSEYLREKGANSGLNGMNGTLYAQWSRSSATIK